MSLNPLDGCVSGLTSSVSLLKSANATLANATEDFPRLRSILQMEQVFDIVAEPEVLEARNEVTNAIEPLVRELLQKVETELKRLERKEKSLTVKAELQLGRLSHIEEKVYAKKERESAAFTKRSTEGPNELQDLNQVSDDKRDPGKALADQRLLDELNQMKKERDRLLYAKSREELQKTHKRMSMAFRKE